MIIIWLEGEEGGARLTLLSSIYITSWYVLLQLEDKYYIMFPIYAVVSSISTISSA